VSAGFIADSSVAIAIAWVVFSQSSGESDHLLEEVKRGTSFVVPVLWMFEVANALLALRRRQRIQRDEYNQALLDLRDSLPLVDDEGPVRALDAISKLAEKHDLSVYDAVYLELALRRALPLASRDAALNKAAKRAGVQTLLASR
jgi:predicted nucleic acid-binding protein